jgi:integrase
MRGSVVKRGNIYSIVVELDRDPITNKRRQKWHSGFPH